MDRSRGIRREIAQGVEESDHFIVRIEWFRTRAQFGPFFAKVKPFFQYIREMKHYEVR